MTLEIGSYEEAVAAHEWRVPERYNIAADCCDKHPARQARDDPRGLRRAPSARSAGASCRSSSNRFANVLRAHGVEQGDRVAMLLPPTPETAAAFFGTFKAGAILLSMSVLYGDDGIRHRVNDSDAEGRSSPTPRTRAASTQLVEILILDDELLAGGEPTFDAVDTSADDPAQLYYSSGTTGLAKGIVHAHRYLLAHEEFIYCHEVQDGERFHGMGEWAWAAGIAPLLGPWRLGAVQVVYQREGGFDPHKQLDFLSRHERHERVHDADRDALDDVDRGRRHALPAEVPPRVLGRRAAEPGGDPLVPRAVRPHGARLLRAHRVLSARRQLPVHGRPRGLDGAADARLGRADPRRGRAAGGAGRARRDLPARAVEPALSARLLAQRRGLARRRSAATGSTPRTPRAIDEDGYVWYEGRADDVIIAAGYRIGPFEVESACLEHAAVAEAAAVASPDERRGNVVKAFIVLADGPRAVGRARRARSRSSCASGCPPTPTRARSSSSTSCRRRSPARSAGSSCASRRWRSRQLSTASGPGEAALQRASSRSGRRGWSGSPRWRRSARCSGSGWSRASLGAGAAVGAWRSLRGGARGRLRPAARARAATSRCSASRCSALLAALRWLAGARARPAAAAPDWDELGSTGSAAARRRWARCGCPYDGADPWPRIVLELLGAGLVIVGRRCSRAGRAPGAAGRGYPFLALAVLLVRRRLAGRRRWAARSSLLLGARARRLLTVCFLWLERLPLRPGLGVAALRRASRSRARCRSPPPPTAASRGSTTRRSPRGLGPNDPVRFSLGPDTTGRSTGRATATRSCGSSRDRAAVLEGAQPRRVRRRALDERRRARRATATTRRPTCREDWRDRAGAGRARSRSRSGGCASTDVIGAGTTMDGRATRRRSCTVGPPGHLARRSGELRRGDSYTAQVYVPTPDRGELAGAPTRPACGCRAQEDLELTVPFLPGEPRRSIAVAVGARRART